MTASYASGRQPTAAAYSMTFDRFYRIPRATWLEAARWAQPRRYSHLISSNEEDCAVPPHVFENVSCRHTSAPTARILSFRTWIVSHCEICAAVCRAMITISRFDLIRGLSCRNHSRIRRFTRFRVVAFPTRRLTVTPRRTRFFPASASRGATSTTKLLARVASPCRATYRNS